MKPRYIFVIIFLLFFIVLTYVVQNYYKYKVESVKETISSNNDIYEMKNIKDDDKKYIIDIYYPYTKYEILNIAIKSKMQKIVDDFKEAVDFEHEAKYNLDISFDYYNYDYYISFAFNVNSDTGGAHPSSNIFTINYDLKNNKIIDIERQ